MEQQVKLCVNCGKPVKITGDRCDDCYAMGVVGDQGNRYGGSLVANLPLLRLLRDLKRRNVREDIDQFVRRLAEET